MCKCRIVNEMLEVTMEDGVVRMLTLNEVADEFTKLFKLTNCAEAWVALVDDHELFKKMRNT